MLKRDRFQGAGRRLAARTKTAVPHGAEGTIGGMKNGATTIEQHALLGQPHRPSGQKVAEQFFVILPDRLRQHAFHMMADRNRQREALRIEGARRTRYVDNSEQLAVARIVNRNGGTGPPLHLGAEVFGAVNLNRLRFGDGGADGVGADIGFAPASAVLQMNRAAGIDDPGISLGVDNQSGGVGEDHDGIGVAEERFRTLQRAAGRMAERSVPGAETKQFGVRDKRRPRAIDRDPVVSGPLP